MWKSQTRGMFQTCANDCFWGWRELGSVTFTLFLFCFVLLCFCFLGLHLRHMEVPRLGAESELQLPPYTTVTAMPDPSRICATYTTALSNAGSLTHWARPGIKPAFSWILVRFIIAEPLQELPSQFWLWWLVTSKRDFCVCEYMCVHRQSADVK